MALEITNLFVQPEEAEAAANQIRAAIDEMETAQQLVNDKINKFDEETKLTWGSKFFESWVSFTKGADPTAIPQIHQNLKNEAVLLDKAAQYSRNYSGN